MITDYFQYAWASIRKRQVRSWFTLIGIFIGIAAVVSLIALGDGMRNAITSQFALLDADKLTVQASGTGQGPPGAGAVVPLDKSYVNKISSVRGVSGVAGRIITLSKTEFNNKLSYTYVASLPDGEERRLIQGSDNLEIMQGRFLRDGDRSKVIVGANFAKADNEYGRAVSTGDRILVNDREFQVIGILERKGSFIVDDIVSMNEEDMRDLYGIPDRYDSIVVEVANVDNLNSVEAEVERVLRKERDVKEGEEDFTVQTPEAALRQLNTVLLAVQVFFVFIAFISLMVGGIGIMNTMYTSVLERTKEIGIMKSLGATNGTIFLLFAIESGFFGMLGGLIGVGIGVSLAKGLAFAGAAYLASDLVRANIAWYLVPGALLFSFLVGLASGALPAYQASKLKPVDALRAIK